MTMHMRSPHKKAKHMARPGYSKGGMIKKIAGRHYFDDGGSTTLGGPSGQGPAAATVNNNGLTGTVGNALGLNNQFQGQAAPIQQGTNAAQLNNAYTGAQSGLTQQQQLSKQKYISGNHFFDNGEHGHKTIDINILRSKCSLAQLFLSAASLPALSPEGALSVHLRNLTTFRMAK